MASLFKYKNSDNWWIKLHRRGQGKGKSDRIPTGTADKAVAKAILAKMEGDIASGLPVHPKAHTILFADLCGLVLEDYEFPPDKEGPRKTLKHARIRFAKHIVPYFRAMLATEMTAGMIDDYRMHRRKQGAKPATIRRDLELIKKAFKIGWRRYRIAGPEFDLPEIQNARKGFFEQADADRVFAACDDPDRRDYLLCLYITGWRTGEVRDLRRRHVCFAEDCIRLDPGTTKNGDPRVFPFSDELREMFARRLAEPGFSDDYVFTYEWHPGQRRPMGDMSKAFATACYKAGIPCVTEPWSYIEPKSGKTFEGTRVVKCSRILHDFRRSAAKNRNTEGIPEPVIMEMMGHRTNAMFKRYRIVSKGDLDMARDKMNAARKSVSDSTEVGRVVGRVSPKGKNKSFRMSGK